MSLDGAGRPVPSGDTVRLAQVADTHAGSADPKVTAGLLDDLAAIAPDATVVCGDLTSRARGRQFADARALLEAMPGPVLVVPGNHDVPLDNPLARLLSPYTGYRNGISPNLDPLLDVPRARILGLNTMPRWRWKAGHVSRRQCRLVRSALGSAPPGSARVLVTHHPVLPAGLSSLAGRSRLVRAAAAAGVDVLLSGHTHDPLLAPVELRAGVVRATALSAVAGTAASTRLRASANSYLVLRISTSTIHAEVRAWNDSRFVPVLDATLDRTST
jgi:3',5'-cyclic AMP phosphodiesterase CpdA